MAKFKRFENGNPKRKERRREDYDAFDAHGRRKFKKELNDLSLGEEPGSRRRPKKDYMYYDDSEDI